MDIDKIALKFYQCCVQGINGKHIVGMILLIFIIVWFCEWLSTE